MKKSALKTMNDLFSKQIYEGKVNGVKRKGKAKQTVVWVSEIFLKKEILKTMKQYMVIIKQEWLARTESSGNVQ